MKDLENTRFEWTEFYQELAEKLLQYKDNRSTLVQKIYQVFDETGINMPKLDNDYKLVDIDPFTVFGLFNKHPQSLESRISIAQKLGELLQLTTPAPRSFLGIPVLNAQNAHFAGFTGSNGQSSVGMLWGFFDSIMSYLQDSSALNLEQLMQDFDAAINLKGNGNSKITMALYWIAPDTFINLDSRNLWYLYQAPRDNLVPREVIPVRLPMSLVRSLPEIDPKTKIAAKTYFEILAKVQEYLQTSKSIKDLKDLSAKAWQYSEAYNKYQRELPEILRGEHGRAFDGENTDTVSSGTNLTYNIDNFLQEVFIEKSDFDTLSGLLKVKKNLILQGAPGVGKTFAAKRLVYAMMGEKDDSRILFTQFHQSYAYEDFVMGYRPTADGFELKYGAFYKFCKLAEQHPERDYFVIIDEINRGNISKIFGELFMLIESDKRGFSNQMVYSDEEFSVPQNLYLIGMMNTADRSLAMLDYALRRRFSFYEFKPAFESEGFKAYAKSLNSPAFTSLISVIEQLNQVICEDDSLGEGFCIGHSYFCNLQDASPDNLSRIVKFEIIPLLKEYWFDEPAKVSEWSQKLLSIVTTPTL